MRLMTRRWPGSVQDARRLLCRQRAKLVQGGLLHDWVRGKLVHQRWPPEQNAARLRVLHPGDPTARVSHETIHAAICAQPKGGLKAAMTLALQQAKPARGLRRTTPAGSPMAPESLRIIHLPQEIGARLIPGLCGMRRVFGNAGSGSTTSGTTRICETTSNIAGSIPSNTAWWMTPRIGPIPPITATTRWVRFHPTEK